MHISEINVYPIKALKAIPVERAVVETRGLRGDRRMVLTDSEGNFLTQRKYPQLAAISVAPNGSGITVSAEGAAPLSIEPLTSGERCRVTVWASESEALAYGNDINNWFSGLLGFEARLFYMPDDAGRPVNERFNKGGDLVSFADGYPLLLTGEASLADVNKKLVEKAGNSTAAIPMNRFRPSIVVAGAEAFGEDRWLRLRVGNTVFRAGKPAGRCVVTTIDQQSGISTGKEPLKTLASYRLAKNIMPGRFESLGLRPESVVFGLNLIPEAYGAVIRIGDEVEILEHV